MIEKMRLNGIPGTPKNDNEPSAKRDEKREWSMSEATAEIRMTIERMKDRGAVTAELRELEALIVDVLGSHVTPAYAVQRAYDIESGQQHDE